MWCNYFVIFYPEWQLNNNEKIHMNVTERKKNVQFCIGFVNLVKIPKRKHRWNIIRLYSNLCNKFVKLELIHFQTVKWFVLIYSFELL